MSQAQWTAVDQYLTGLFVPPDEALDGALADSAAAGLPAIAVSPNQGKLLHLMARMTGARRVLEIGTLGGYSTIWLGRALPPAARGGKLVTLEFEPKHAEVARGNLARAGLGDVVEVVLGPALESLRRMVAEGVAPFDFVFIDANKTGYADYLEWSLKLSRPGTVIVADNVVRKGAVVDANSADANVQGVRRYNELVAKNPRLSATALQTVGSKGYDGFTIAVVNG
jgi:predicted O-methyltransferase YrrM